MLSIKGWQEEAGVTSLYIVHNYTITGIHWKEKVKGIMGNDLSFSWIIIIKKMIL